ncbi:conjugal transfer protein TraX [Candidatus Bathyarchaeota archaeon]|nr:conjugal transfer protein TraX [Candidatus Bathyarchaeota archaeon]
MGRELLKWFALITMTIDHLGAVFFPNDIGLRIIGRVSFPLYCYLLVLGLESSKKNPKTYFARLFTFALISQVPYFLAFNYQPLEVFNIFFTLSLGLISLLHPLLILLGVLIAEILRFDYGAYGIALIGGMYVLQKNKRNGVICLIILNAFSILLWDIQIFSLLALPIILFYQEVYLKFERKTQRNIPYPAWRQYFFYVYYPLHLSVISILKIFVMTQ